MADAMTDGSVLAAQYGTGARLFARQSLWDLAPGPPLSEVVLDLARLTGDETVLDVGCGNGLYLAELRRRGHAGPVLGLDLHEGMARMSAAHAATVVADASELPLHDGSVDVAMCLHMLYHVSDIDRALRELRRVLRPTGRTVVATNGLGHTAELKAVLADAARTVADLDVDRLWDFDRFSTDRAHAALSGVFGSVEVHEVGGSFEVADPEVVGAAIASWPPEAVGLTEGPVWAAILTAARDLVYAHVAAHGSFRVTGRAAVLVAS